MFGPLKYPFAKYKDSGLESWAPEVVTRRIAFYNNANWYYENAGSVTVTCNNRNQVFYAYNNLGLDTVTYDAMPRTLLNAPKVGRKLVRLAANTYNTFRLWDLLGY